MPNFHLAESNNLDVVGCFYCQNFHSQIPLAEPNDFTAISGTLLLFDQSTQSVSVNVSIADDMIFEGTEMFQASLTLVDPFIPTIITVSPSLANISIEDDDSKLTLTFWCGVQ